jgi:tetratricopeptide (TPR) repeat protein/cold shock CspA family protein
MPTQLPRELLVAVAEGRAVPFLGAGASRGATDDKGNGIPTATELASKIVDAFLGPDYKDCDFRSAYDLACSSRDVLAVQKFVFDLLSPFRPADFQLLLASFPWAGILTTNYDLVVERAFSKAKPPLQRLVPNLKDDDGATDRLDQRSVLYVKLHGCITRHHDLHPPLVASTEQLIAFREGRQGQFDTFLEWAKTKTLIFIGYSFLDSNLRLLFNEVIREGDNRPRHYIINRNLLPAEEGYWRDRRVVALNFTFEQFLTALEKEVPEEKRALGVVAKATLHETSFTRFITTSGRRESDDLKSYLTSLAEHVTPDIDPGPDDPKKFYRGFDLGWFSIKHNLDVYRTITDEILIEQVIPNPLAERPKIVVVKGHAGSGKSVLLRRLAWEAAKNYGRLCFFISRRGIIDVQRFEEIFSLTNLPVFLFIDSVSEHKDRLVELIELIGRTRASVRIVCAESFVLWNSSCAELDSYVSQEYEMRYLSEPEIEQLLGKLETHKSLGYLAELSNAKRKEELRFVHSRQLLVALLEATHGVPLIEILIDEYNSIPTNEASRLYLDICCLHRFGPPVRAGLISRIHDISFDEFRDKFFRPLEQVVLLRLDAKSADYVYEARHSHIAHELYRVILLTQDERFDNIVRIVTKLNPSFSYDLEVLSRLIRAENIRSTLSDPIKGRQVYDAAIASAGRRTVILHQRGIYEMHVAANRADLDRAEDILEEALSLEPYNRPIKHSLAELALHRSRLSTDPLERQTFRRIAAERARALTSWDNAYPHHTIVKAAVDDVRDLLHLAEGNQSEANVAQLGEAIVRAEEALRRAQQGFPNNPVLLGEEGELSNVLSQAQRAEAAFQKAFAANPRSTLLARRLSRIQRAKGAYAGALTTLRTSIEANPSSRELHNDIAMTLLESSPDGDQQHSEEILYHLRRAFSPGDKNYHVQFWYARELCLVDKYEEGRTLFATLAEAKISNYEKTQIKGLVRDKDGNPRRFSGSIVALKPSFAFVQSDAPKMRVFVQIRDHEAIESKDLAVGFPVSFDLAFTMRGPTAQNLALLQV